MLDRYIHGAGCKWHYTLIRWGARADLPFFTNVAESVISCVTIRVTTNITADITAGVSTNATVGVATSFTSGVPVTINEG